MKIAFLLFFLLLTAALGAFAQTASIRGKIVARAGGQNMVGAQVWLVQNGKVRSSTLSDREGTFVLENIVAGTYNLECHVDGYVKQRIMGLQLRAEVTKLAYFRMAVSTETDPKKAKGQVEEIWTYASLQAKMNAELAAATASAESQLDVPATGYVVSAEDIHDRGYTNLLEVLADIPEIEIQEKVSPTTLNILSTRGLSGSGRFVILQDGIRINSMLGSDIVIAQNFDIRHARRIEIIIGPASAIYGADAFSGVINIVTDKGNKLNSASATLSYGQYNTTDNAFQIGWGKGDWSVAASGNFHRSDEPDLSKSYPSSYDWYLNNYIPNGTMYVGVTDTLTRPVTDNTSGGARSTTFSHLLQMWTGRFRVNYKNWELGGSHQTEYHNSSVGFASQFSIPQRLDYGTSLTNLYVHHLAAPQERPWTLQSILHANYWEINPNSSFVNVYTNDSRAYRFGYEKTLEWRELLTYKLSDHHRFVGGLSAQYSHALAQTADLPRKWQRGLSAEEQGLWYLGTNRISYRGDTLRVPLVAFYENRFNAGAFAQYQGDFFQKKLEVTAGIRADYIYTQHPQADTSYGFFTANPRLGLVYKPSESWRVKAFYGEAVLNASPQKSMEQTGAFVPVTVAPDSVSDVLPGYWHLPSLDTNRLVPEKVRSVELGLVFTKNDWVVAFNGYYNLADRLIQNQTFERQAFSQQYPDKIVPVGERAANQGKGWMYGGSVRVDYRVNLHKKGKSELRLWGSYSFLDGQIQNDADSLIALPFSAHHTAKAGAQLRWQRFRMSVSGLYRSPSVNFGFYDAYERTYEQFGNPAFFALNGFVAYQLFPETKSLGLELFARVRNLTNQSYYHTSDNNDAYLHAVPQDPIRVTIGLKADFK